MALEGADEAVPHHGEPIARLQGGGGVPVGLGQGSQPRLRPWPGIGAVVEPQHQLAQVLVAAGSPIGLHQVEEGGRRLGIPPLEDLVEDFIPQELRLVLAGHPGRRVQAQAVEVLPGQPQAEAVERGDGRPSQEGQLPAQPRVLGPFGQGFLQPVPDPFLHLGGGGLGEGDHQQPVDLHRFPRVEEAPDDPLHQHRGLAGTRRRADQDGAPHPDGLLLGRRPAAAGTGAGRRRYVRVAVRHGLAHEPVAPSPCCGGVPAMGSEGPAITGVPWDAPASRSSTSRDRSGRRAR